MVKMKQKKKRKEREREKGGGTASTTYMGKTTLHKISVSSSTTSRGLFLVIYFFIFLFFYFFGMKSVGTIEHIGLTIFATFSQTREGWIFNYFHRLVTDATAIDLRSFGVDAAGLTILCKLSIMQPTRRKNSA